MKKGLSRILILLATISLGIPTSAVKAQIFPLDNMAQVIEEVVEDPDSEAKLIWEEIGPHRGSGRNSDGPNELPLPDCFQNPNGQPEMMPLPTSDSEIPTESTEQLEISTSTQPC